MCVNILTNIAICSQMVARKLENCLECHCMLQIQKKFPLLELRGLNIFQPGNAHLHQCIMDMVFQEVKWSAENPDLIHSEHHCN